MAQISIPRALVFPNFYRVLYGRQGGEDKLVMTVKTTWHIEFLSSPSSLISHRRKADCVNSASHVKLSIMFSHVGFFWWRKEPINSTALRCCCKQPCKTQAACKAVQSTVPVWCLSAVCADWRIHSIPSLQILPACPLLCLWGFSSHTSSNVAHAVQHWLQPGCSLLPLKPINPTFFEQLMLWDKFSRRQLKSKL